MYEGNYKKLPNRKKKLLTKEFLTDLKQNLIAYSIENDKRNGCYNTDYSNESYYSFYGNIEISYLFDEALYDTCKKHNLIHAIYDYNDRMPWYDSDVFLDDIVGLMVDYEIIPYKNESDDKGLVNENKIKYVLTYHYKGYNVLEYDYWDKNDKQILEDIYSDYANVTIDWNI